MNALKFLAALIIGCILILLIMAFLLSREVFAHSWYPQNCCSSVDCEVLPVENINETADGWHVQMCSTTRPGLCTAGFIKRGQERHSEDGRFHLCFNATRIICFFQPSVT